MILLIWMLILLSKSITHKFILIDFSSFFLAVLFLFHQGHFTSHIILLLQNRAYYTTDKDHNILYNIPCYKKYIIYRIYFFIPHCNLHFILFIFFYKHTNFPIFSTLCDALNNLYSKLNEHLVWQQKINCINFFLLGGREWGRVGERGKEIEYNNVIYIIQESMLKPKPSNLKAK